MARLLMAGTWPGGDGEMARRIRDFDWTDTSVGPTEGWPASVRAAVEMILSLAFPASLHCGPERVQIYNDRYIPFIGTRHPKALGRPTRATCPEITADIERVLDRAAAGETLLEQDQHVSYLRASGEREDAWFAVSHQPVRDSDRTVAVLSVGVDTTERVRAEQAMQAREDRHGALLRELDHRTSNLMTVVQAISDHTVRTSASLGDFADKFDHRLGALARAQRLVARRIEGEAVVFEDVLAAEIAALGAGSEAPARIWLDGPDGVLLDLAAVQVLGMALHELATNALKYGALHPRTGGRLEVIWRVEDEGAGRWLVVDWTERLDSDAPAPNPSPRGGRGRMLIERVLPAQTGARTRYEISPRGVVCRIAVPIPDEAAPIIGQPANGLSSPRPGG